MTEVPIDQNPIMQAMLTAADRMMDLTMPDGISTNPAQAWTTTAFDFYVANHGIPTTANEARRMFEFAACLEHAYRLTLREVSKLL